DGGVVADERKAGAAAGAEGRSALSESAAKPALPVDPANLIRHSNLSIAELREYGASALRAIAANKVRSGLSMLGILIGVAAVIAMLAIGKGAQKAIEARL